MRRNLAKFNETRGILKLRERVAPGWNDIVLQGCINYFETMPKRVAGVLKTVEGNKNNTKRIHQLSQNKLQELVQ